MTPIQELMNHLIEFDYFIGDDLIIKYRELIRKERIMIQQAMLHALDEDGHTGEWKVEFINNYCNNLQTTKNKSDE